VLQRCKIPTLQVLFCAMAESSTFYFTSVFGLSYGIQTLKLSNGLLLSGAGSIAGLVITAGMNGLLRGMFPSSQGIDLSIYALVVPALLAITLLAALVPALRAARIDPLAALRQD